MRGAGSPPPLYTFRRRDDLHSFVRVCAVNASMHLREAVYSAIGGDSVGTRGRGAGGGGGASSFLAVFLSMLLQTAIVCPMLCPALAVAPRAQYFVLPSTCTTTRYFALAAHLRVQLRAEIPMVAERGMALA
jgi:hypothetical protein